MRWGALFGIIVAIAGCDAEQPESIRAVAAFEIPLPLEKDLSEFLSLLREVAEEEGLHVDAASHEDIRRRTVFVGVLRGANLEASVMGCDVHLGQVSIMFSRGDDPQRAAQFRERTMQAIRQRWPETLSIPVMPSGATPLHRDLIRTPAGYVVDPAAASRYQEEDGKPRPP
jgi:hypothetical protein